MRRPVYRLAGGARRPFSRLREKVADEVGRMRGRRRQAPCQGELLLGGIGAGAHPALRATFSRKREKGSYSSRSGCATKIRTRRMNAVMRNAGCWPFQTWDCHIAYHSPPTAVKPTNQTRNPQAAPAKTKRLA